MEPTLLRRLIARISLIASDPGDTPEVALQKRLVLALTLVPAPAGTLWGIIYFAAGAHLAGFILAAYSVVAVVNTALFAVTRDLRLYRFSQLVLILLLPWLLMTSLGGFKDSSAVIIWSALCPLAALLLDDLRQTVLWLLGFLALLVVSGLIQPYLQSAPLPDELAIWGSLFSTSAQSSRSPSRSSTTLSVSATSSRSVRKRFC